MTARDRILAKLRPHQRGANGDIERPLGERARGPAPTMRSDLPSLFFENAKRLGSDVAKAQRLADVPATVVRYLDAHGLTRRAVCWPDLTDLAWDEVNVTAEARAARGDDVIGVTGTFAGVAETGTLMLLSGPRTPATVSLLPETHVAIVHADQIVATMEDAWARMRNEWGPIPRAVNFVSGPSRTADVEQTVTLGAHGPRRVLIVLVSAR